MEPISTRLPFTRETLAAALKAEFARLQPLGSVIDETIEEVRR
jgi:hypothetical protein